MSGRAQAPGGKTWGNNIVGSWVEEAACQGCDPELWYPPEVHGRRTRSERLDADAAKQVCESCAVRVECLRFALEHAEPWGVWGGATPAERRQLAQGPPPISEMSHGSEAGSKAHRRRGEDPCRRCRDAAALASRLRHAKIREAR